MSYPNSNQDIIGDPAMNASKETKAKAWNIRLLPAITLATLATCYTQASQAGATFKIDDTKWVSIGAGLKTSFTTKEDGAGATSNKWANDFRLDNLRLYMNAQIHKYIKFTFNTECANCGDGGDIRILDGIAQFEYNPYINLWAGRQLVPEGRIEMNGPFYSATYEPFKQPFESSDSTIQNVLPGPDAGTFGRDEGVNFWGAAFDGHLKYVFGAFEGLKRRNYTTGGQPPMSTAICFTPLVSPTIYCRWRMRRAITPAAPPTALTAMCLRWPALASIRRTAREV
jgi:hypothetical protein